MRLPEKQACLTEQAVEVARLKTLMARHQATAVSTGELKQINEAATALRDRIESSKKRSRRCATGSARALAQSRPGLATLCNQQSGRRREEKLTHSLG